MTSAGDGTHPQPGGSGKASDPAHENNRSMKPFILLLAAVVVVGGAIALVYKLNEPETQSMSFRLDDSLRGQVNATVLDGSDLRGMATLRDHLNTAVASGSSHEGLSLRVDEMRRALEEVTREAGPVWHVLWNDRLVVVTASAA